MAVMGGETESDVSAWTIDSLKEFFMSLLAEHEKLYEQRFEAQEKATAAALAAAEKASLLLEDHAQQWREQSNEWRAALNDRERDYLPRTEAIALEKQNATRISTLIDRFDKLEDRVNKREDQSTGLSKAWGYVIGGVGVVAAVVAIVIALIASR